MAFWFWSSRYADKTGSVQTLSLVTLYTPFLNGIVYSEFLTRNAK